MLLFQACGPSTEKSSDLDTKKQALFEQIGVMTAQTDAAEESLFKAFEAEYMLKLKTGERELWRSTVLQHSLTLDYAAFLLGAMRHAENSQYASDLLFCMQELFGENLELSEGVDLNQKEIVFYHNLLKRRLLERQSGPATPE
jgi:hypothetical protein